MMAYRSTPRTEANRLALRARLLDAAREVLAEGGYAAAGVSALAERAGVATGSVYTHFSSKQELLAAVFRHIAGHELATVEQAVRSQRTAAGKLRTLVEVFSSRALRTPRTAWALLAEPVDPLVEAERLVYRRGYHALAEEAVAAGVASGELPPQDPALSAAAVIGAVGEALLGPLSPVAGQEGDPARDRRTVAALTTVCLRAVGARPTTEPVAAARQPRPDPSATTSPGTSPGADPGPFRTAPPAPVEPHHASHIEPQSEATPS